MCSESMAEGRMGYWLRGHEGERNNCFSKTQLVGQKYRDKTTLGTCQKLAGGSGVETDGGSQLFETAEKAGVMKNGPLKGGGSCKHVSMIM